MSLPQPYPNRSEGFIECLHPVGAVPAHGFGHVGVFIQCECRGEMPHILLHRFHVITGPQRRNRIRMSQIMETVMLQTCLLQNVLKEFVEEQKFENAEALTAQIRKDQEAVREWYEKTSLSAR